jgi:hypothetical protein
MTRFGIGEEDSKVEKSPKVIVKVSTSAFILFRSPANSAKPSGQLPLINFCNLDQNQFRNWAAAGARGRGGGAADVKPSPSAWSGSNRTEISFPMRCLTLTGYFNIV